MLTEEQAREKWCPMARHISTADEGSCANRWSGGKGGEIDNPAECRCIASGCMAWRWARRSCTGEFAGYRALYPG